MDRKTKEKLLRIVKTNYEEIAEDFHETRKKFLWPELLKLTAVVRSGDRVLDAGCGNGRLLGAFQGKKINYTGIDASEELIKLAHRSTAAVNFVNLDILELNKLPVGDFDYVFSVAVLHHLPGQDLRIEALRQMKNKLGPGGKIILSVWNLWPRKKFRALIVKQAFLKIIGRNRMDFGDILFDWKNNRGKTVSQRYYHAFTKRGLKKIIKQVGLKIEKLYKDEHNYYAILRSAP